MLQLRLPSSEVLAAILGIAFGVAASAALAPADYFLDTLIK